MSTQKAMRSVMASHWWTYLKTDSLHIWLNRSMPYLPNRVEITRLAGGRVDQRGVATAGVAANAAWLAVQVMAHNLARWTARIGLGAHAGFEQASQSDEGLGQVPARQRRGLVEGADDPRDRAASDISRCEQHAGAPVGFRGQLLARELRAAMLATHVAIAKPSNQTADEDRTRRRERQVDANGKGERRDAGHFQDEGDHHAEERGFPDSPQRLPRRGENLLPRQDRLHSLRGDPQGI